MSVCDVEFAMLAVLAGAGELDREEQEMLAAHMEGCAACWEIVAEVGLLGPRLGVVAGREYAAVRVPRGMEARFRARAMGSGINLPRGGRTCVGYGLQLASFAVVLLLGVSLVLGRIRGAEPSIKNGVGMGAGAVAPVVEAEVMVAPPAVRARVRSVRVRDRSGVKAVPRFKFVWPPIGTDVPKAFASLPRFSTGVSTDLHALVASAVLVPDALVESRVQVAAVDNSPFHYGLDLTRLHLRESPKSNLEATALRDFSFIPNDQQP